MKRILSVILALALMAVTSITAVAQEYTPTQIDGVYQLGTANDLIWFANKVNNATVDNEDYKINAALTADIDMTGYDWQPIGKPILDGISGGGVTITTTQSSSTVASSVDDTTVADYPKSPQTGDNANTLIWIAALFAAGVILTANSVYNRHKRKN